MNRKKSALNAADRIARLEVDARPMLRELRDHEAAAIELEDDPLVDAIGVLLFAQNQRPVSGIAHGRGNRRRINPIRAADRRSSRRTPA